MSDRSPWPLRIVKGFARFWWDFLVGDTPELFVAVLVVVGLVALCRIVWQLNVLALVALPLLCMAALGVSLGRAQRTSREK
jgi:ABC-type bacteriocin/lantibiotic exporter with double-glycine peptidase domain